MTAAQQRFAATHFAGTQKLSLDLSRPLRAINPGFLVLHYHLAMWQSAPGVNYIVDGTTWGNDFDEVNRHESWFWHNPAGQRVTSSQDRKRLMNVADPGFRAYWKASIAAQVQSGDFDAVFLDSASPALLQWEARTPEDARLLGTGVKEQTFAELGGRSWIAAWDEWIADLNGALEAKRIPLIPNVGGLATSWDTSNYSLTSGVFSEGFGDPRFDTADWRMSANQLLALAGQGKIVILQNYVPSEDDVARRRYLLATYLLVKGSRTYLSYYGSSTLSWFPEWDLDLGPAVSSARALDDLEWNGLYRREFANGVVLLNPGARMIDATLGRTYRRVEPAGGGALPATGVPAGAIKFSQVTRLQIAPKTAEILLK